ncbi:Ribonuclease H-like domain containing protein [Parasponia andersonii]|uniref:Ribonuclease H-like domain containing protein n=1 Tax=Parasponia andersonii TaxID=3476 RepID=A0A2P5B5U5_PARAD|nr:Ribonuclease H-like domain containing protein [Parasponia andersonii]
MEEYRSGTWINKSIMCCIVIVIGSRLSGPCSPTETNWCPSLFNQNNLHTDAAVKSRHNFIGVRALIRYHEGQVLAAASKFFFGCFSIETTELLAVRGGIVLAGRANLPISRIEFDALRVVQGLKSCSPFASLAPIYFDVKFLCSSANHGPCHFITRDGNKVTYYLADLAFRYPRDIEICSDLIV